MTAPYVIDQVSWHTMTPGNPETRDQTVRRFCAVANFLQDKGLTVRNLGCAQNDIDDDFAIRSDDLTEDGLAVVRAVYDKWLAKVDHGMSPEDLSLFESTLKKIRVK